MYLKKKKLISTLKIILSVISFHFRSDNLSLNFVRASSIILLIVNVTRFETSKLQGPEKELSKKKSGH